MVSLPCCEARQVFCVINQTVNETFTVDEKHFYDFQS